jgi:hypothetical protein
MTKIKRKNAKWKFSVHDDPDKGPNRITFDPTDALRFYRKRVKGCKAYDGPIIRVQHLPSKLVWETDDPEELNEFICVLVDRVGAFHV